jgi:pimeloyl-ACP methyl ester carboxylesterase
VKALSVTSADGVRLAVHETGNPAGLEILLIHGFNQSHLSWTKQFSDPNLSSEFRMVAFDLRGHGASDKPLDPACYADNARWAADVAAVIATAGLKRPVVVGWSYAGRVITDYLRASGTDGIAGVNFVGAVLSGDSAFMGPGRSHFGGMLNEDLATNIASTARFVRTCFERQPTVDEFETILAYNMVVPPQVRKLVLGRSLNTDDLLAKINVPVLLSYGAKDQLILPAMGEHGAKHIPGAKLSLYEGIGHAPFHEDAARFNSELAAFVRAAQR